MSHLRETLIFMYMQKTNLIPNFFLEILHLKNSEILLAESVLALNLWTRILPDKEFMVK